MTIPGLVRSSLSYYWRPNLAVALGVATAVAVLGGALLVGESVRASLRRIALERIGSAEHVVTSTTPFREQLASAWRGGAPLMALEGLVTHQASSRRATGIFVYGVDDRFWQFHGQPAMGLGAREAAVSTALAAELGLNTGDTLLLRVEKPTDIPAESLFGRKDDPAPTIRLTAKAVLPGAQMGEFTLRPTQGAVRALFVPLRLIQREMNVPGRVNAILLGRSAGAPEQMLRSAFQLEDLGLRVRKLDDRDALQLDTLSGVIPDSLVGPALQAANDARLETRTMFTYLATALRLNGKEVPYSLVAATDLQVFSVSEPARDSIVLNDWTARDLGAKPGDTITMAYMLWHPDNRISEESASFRVASVTPMKGLAGDRDLAPEYPGITDADNVADWDPPFPMELKRIRDKDEDYWDAHRATPKAFLTLEKAQELWSSRWGKLTGIRMQAPNPEQPEALERALHDFRTRLRLRLDPLEQGLIVVPLRQMSLEASRGATDFGEYFTYFSFFLMVSALLLAGLFFRLGLEQRFTEVGLLQAAGFAPAVVRRIFLWEGVLLSLAGGLVGVLGAVGYAAAVVTGLTTFWVDAVGTRNLSLSVAGAPLLAGLVGGIVAAVIAVLLTLRGVRALSPRGLLATGAGAAGKSRAGLVAAVAGLAGLTLLVASALKAIPAAAGFFGAGSMLLVAALGWFRTRLGVHGIAASLPKLAFRNAGYRPGRTVLSAALIASATFLVVSVESFRRDPNAAAGTGGYPLMAEAVRPLYYNPETPKGREELPDLPPNTNLAGFRLRPGDDASCLNLYEPQNPRILGAPRSFAGRGRFPFAAAVKDTPNPWMLLFEPQTDGAVPAIADANSITYVLHKKVGDVFTLPDGTRLRLVAALADSVFQSEIIVGEDAFQRLFPREQGYRVFLIETSDTGKATADLEEALSDHGFDVTPTADRLATFHRVENTYLSTFQTLGALGLLLGTIGLGAVLFRNVLERRREFALLAAIGYTRERLSRLVLLENIMLLVAGIAIGLAAALLAIAPVLIARGSQASALSMGVLLAAVLAAGLAATWVATRVSMRLRLMDSLRAG
ncbi:MAG: FtsX-like permease family protein [Bryobacterales bacterium]|nr:FtsX-like permease family protein [Bryobacterales bacterium]